MEYRIEVNLGRKDGPKVWHYLMDDDFSPCVFDNEADARAVIAEENRGEDIRLATINFKGDA